MILCVCVYNVQHHIRIGKIIVRILPHPLQVGIRLIVLVPLLHLPQGHLLVSPLSHSKFIIASTSMNASNKHAPSLGDASTHDDDDDCSRRLPPMSTTNALCHQG